MKGKIMVLLDSFSVRGEAVQYAIELAKRMDYSLLLLVLLGLDSAEVTRTEEVKLRGREALRSPLQAAAQAKVAAAAEVRIGDPSSELMKFLAGSGSVRTIVWGGTPDLIPPRRKPAHWLLKVKDLVECPVVIPSLKS